MTPATKSGLTISGVPALLEDVDTDLGACPDFLPGISEAHLMLQGIEGFGWAEK